MKKILIIQIILSILLLSMNCKTKEAPEIKDVFMVIYSSRSSTVLREGKQFKAVPGFILQMGDTINTGNGTMDIQNRSGSIIRLRDSSTLSINTLLKSPQNKADFSLKEGAMIAQIKKLSSNDEYTVHTPTAIAGVRGTTFSVELDDDQSPKVRVYEGSVSLKPNIAELNDKSEDEINSDDRLQELKDIQDKQEVVLEEEKSAKMDQEMNKAIQNINSSSGDEKNIETLKNMNPPAAESAPVTEKEQSEIATLTGVDSALLNEEIEKPAADQPDQETSAKIKDNYNKNLKSSLKTMEENSNLKTVDDLIKHYKLYEKLVRKNGMEQTGSIVTQVGDEVIFHSTEGIYQIQTDEINYVDYFTEK